MFPPFLRHSLLAQALTVIGLLLFVTLVRAGSVASLHWMGRHDVPALSSIASLHEDTASLWRRSRLPDDSPRVQARQAAVALQEHLDAPALQAAVRRPGRDELLLTWQQLDRHWTQELRPLLEQGRSDDYRRASETFSRDLARLSAGLQAEHARLLALDLRFAAGTLLALLGILSFSLYILLRRVVLPLRELLATTDRFRAGNLDVRVAYAAPDEIGSLAQRFNAMADDLADSHRHLEQQVADKMQHLGRANAVLELLFRSSAGMAHGPAGATVLADLLARFQALVPGLELTLCLAPQPGGPLIALHGADQQQICTSDQCDCYDVPAQAPQHSYDVCCRGEVLGTLRACVDPARLADAPEPELLQALADLIGSVLGLGRQREKDGQLLLHNERSTIARELHDSLAQSLSYMKIQVSCLQTMIRRHDDCALAESVAAELREGINDAYRQLRELLTTFRLGLGGDELGDALQAAVEEFSRRGDMRLLLEADSLLVPLSGIEQIHVLQIVREALGNCLRHSGARQAWVTLRQSGQDVELRVEDDGRGLSPLASEVQRHGMAIMHERARGIGGSLIVAPRHPQGTRVQLRFRPGALAAGMNGETA